MCNRARRCRTSSRKSGIVGFRDIADRFDKSSPVRPALGQNLLSFSGDAIVAAPPLPGLFHPATLNPPALFELIEQGIERRHAEPNAAGRTPLDQLADFISMAR